MNSGNSIRNELHLRYRALEQVIDTVKFARKEHTMKPRAIESIVSVSVFLFFLQALRVIFSVLFGIIYDQIFEGPMDAWLVISNLLVLLAFAAPLFSPKKNHYRWSMIFAVLTSLARINLSINQADVRFWGSLLTVAFGGLYLTTQLQLKRRLFVQTMLGALVLDQFLRVLGDTYDISLRGSWLYVQILWGLAVFALVIIQIRRSDTEQAEPGEIRFMDGVALSGFIFLQVSLLSLPNAVTHWSELSHITTTGASWNEVQYFVSAIVLMGITLIFCSPGVRDLFLRVFHTPLAGMGLSLLLLLGLMVGYFSEGFISLLGLFVALFASLSAFDSAFAGVSKPSLQSGRNLALGLILFLVLNFFNAFTFTYPYTLPALRGMGWFGFLIAGGLLGAGAILRLLPLEFETPKEIGFVPGGLLALCIFIATLVVSWPRTSQWPRYSPGMRIATYNIHYGYDDVWHFSLEDIASAIAEEKVSAVVMQEVDAGRMTSYCVDDALFLARRLDMNYVYLPTVEHLTGIAVLYRGPLMPSKQQLITSLQEQTGIIGVSLEFDGEPLNVHGVWMGLSDEDTQTQILEALEFIGDQPNAVFGGDFNAEDHEPVPQAVLAAGFEDPFAVLGIDPPPPTSPAIDPSSRIDYVWIRDLDVSAAWVSSSLASDHRMVVIEVEGSRH
jgi:endonuclease/exonuclease/phosphatase family metal-dependent hydrolase